MTNHLDDNNYRFMAEYVAQGWDTNFSNGGDGQFFLLIFIAAILGLGKGGVPGFATAATALTAATAPTNIPGGLGFAVSLQVPILTMIDVSAAWLHAKDLHWESIWLLLPISFIGMALGQWLDQRLSESAARLLVGILLLVIFSSQVWNSHIQQQQTTLKTTNAKTFTKSKYSDVENNSTTNDDYYDERNNNKFDKKNDNSSKTTKWVWAVIVGLVGGAATMLTNAMGPVLNLYLLSVAKLSPSEYIGTRAMFFCFLNVGKIPMRFASGTLGWTMLPLAGSLGLVSVAGVVCAKPIMLSMKESSFVALEISVVAFSALRLCWMGIMGMRG